jgi:hypothetical protein
MLMICAAPRNQERAAVQSIEEPIDLVEYESGYSMSGGRGIGLPSTIERSPATVMPDSAGEVQNETATSSSKRPVIDRTGTAFVQRGVKRKSQDPETPRKKVQKSRPQDSNNIERETQMGPPPTRQAAIRGQEKTKDMINFFRLSPREISQAIEERRAAPIISCNCNKLDCSICYGINSRDDEE